MTKKKICFIAQFPPPVHGVSKVAERLLVGRPAKAIKTLYRNL